MTDADRSSGAVAFAAIGGMLATGIAWASGLALLPGLGWGRHRVAGRGSGLFRGDGVGSEGSEVGDG
jgi:hypothetical protein